MVPDAIKSKIIRVTKISKNFVKIIPVTQSWELTNGKGIEGKYEYHIDTVFNILPSNNFYL